MDLPQVQEAYDNLSDPAKRREFDSIDEFDDTLPESCAPADFLRVHICVETHKCLSDCMCSSRTLQQDAPSRGSQSSGGALHRCSDQHSGGRHGECAAAGAGARRG